MSTRTTFYWRAVGAISVVCLAATWAPDAHAQAFAAVKGKEVIPRTGYQSWSLFLVTNQNWLVPENTTRLEQLYERSKVFGRTIGADHLAVWFWKKDAVWQNQTIADNIDVERAVAYCQKLGLKPGDGPYILFTTDYPDENTVPSHLAVLGLAGRSADEIARFLTNFGNQLVGEGVVRAGAFVRAAASDDFWSAWFDATRHALAEFGSKFTFAIRTPSFTIESGIRPGGGG